MNRQPRPRDLRAQAQDLRAQIGRAAEARGDARTQASAFGPGPAVRLLPAVIIAAVFMLGFRVQIVVQDIANTRTATVKVEPSAANAAAAPAPAAPAPAAPAPAAPAPAAGAQAQAGQPAPAAGAEVPAAAAPAEGTGQPVAFDPSTLSKSEIDVLQRLAERRSTVEKRERERERELEAKDGLLKAAEARIDGKIAQLQDLEKNIKGLLQQYDGQKQQELDQLVRIYSAMKPKEAAGIFETLDMPILLALVQKMKEAKVAPIMALMTPAKATALTEAITSRKQLSAAP